MYPRRTIEAFDDWLATRDLQLDATIVGGSALVMLGFTDRQTRDVDILYPSLSEEIVNAAKSFAAHLRAEGVELDDDWLNNGPIRLSSALPSGWETRVQPLFNGRALKLNTLARADLLKSKLFALCDRGTDLADCIAMGPSINEIDIATPWLIHKDTHPGWTKHVYATLQDLKERVQNGV